MNRQAEIRAEIKLLTAVYSLEVFEGPTVRQEKPACCGREINLFATDVSFRKLAVGKNEFHLLEPRCPECGRRVSAVYSILN